MSRTLEPKLLALFAQALSRGPAALFVRHAERGPVTDIANHDKVLLTTAGEEAATESGRQLYGHVPTPLTFAHSPVPRCGQTARGLLAGLQERGGEGALHGVLPEVGSTYLRDPPRVGLAYLKHGKNFIRAWFDGDIDKDVIAPCDDARGLFAAHPAVIVVSHDWNIAAVREHFLGARFEDVGWPDFLDGVVVDDRSVRCLRAGL